MTQIIWELLIKIPKKEVLIIGFLILAFHQILKYFLHMSSFIYDKNEVSLLKSYSIIGTEFSIVSVSVLAALLQSKSGVISNCKNPGAWGLIIGLSFIMAGILSIIFVHRAYLETNLTKAYLFYMRKYSLVSGSIILGLFSIGAAIYCC